jgi:hypothetical protein
MGQDRFTGSEANKFGREYGAKIIGRVNIPRQSRGL